MSSSNHQKPIGNKEKPAKSDAADVKKPHEDKGMVDKKQKK